MTHDPASTFSAHVNAVKNQRRLAALVLSLGDHVDGCYTLTIPKAAMDAAAGHSLHFHQPEATGDVVCTLVRKGGERD